MAYVTPKTWTFQEVLTADDLNVFARGNAEALATEATSLETRITAAEAAAPPSTPPEFEPGDGTGTLLQVQTVTFTGTWFTNTYLQWLTIDPLVVSITPESASSKILVMADIALTAGSSLKFRVTRNNGLVFPTSAVGGLEPIMSAATANFISTDRHSSMFLDAPASTSVVTYRPQVRLYRPSESSAARNGVRVNRTTAVDLETAAPERFALLASAFTLMEFAA